MRLEGLKGSLNSGSDNYKVLKSDKNLTSYHGILKNPSEIESLLRFQLVNGLNGMPVLTRLSDGYHSLLKSRPTWPYYYSGLAQIDSMSNDSVINNLTKAIQYGAHERKVVKSVAEILFFNWEKIEENDKSRILDYLYRQNESLISDIVAISAKFAKIYVFCDYIYEKKHVEYATCKQQYWQPLSDL